MYIVRTLGAIFTIFILSVHCDNAANYNEITRIYVPSEPQNLTANTVTSEEIHLSWAPPLTSKAVTLPDPKREEQTDNLSVIAKKETNKPQSDEPINEVIPDMLSDSPSITDFDYETWSKRTKYNPQFREKRSHRHRKRRQNNATETKPHQEKMEDVETHQAIDMSIDVVKKSATPVAPLKNPALIAYVLYYEQGVPRSETSVIYGVQSSDEVKNKNWFSSDMYMTQYSKDTKNLTLLNTSGVVTKVVGFRLKNLKPFTPYKIWVRAFYNFSLEGVKSSDLIDRLGPPSAPLYVLTDVKPPSAPIVLNLTCDQSGGILFLQWRQPRVFNNSLDQYVVTLRKVPEEQPRTRLTLPTNKNDIETTIMVNVDLSNITQYEVKIYAVTLSVARHNLLVNGTESPPEVTVTSLVCNTTYRAFRLPKISV